jgi:hypothetical protein
VRPSGRARSGDQPPRFGVRDRQAVHDAVTRRFRPEPARLPGARENSLGRDQGFQRAVDALRNDGFSAMRQRQFRDAYERERTREGRRWGDVEGEGDDGPRPLSSFGEAVRRRRVRAPPGSLGLGEALFRRRSPSPPERETADILSTFVGRRHVRARASRARLQLDEHGADGRLLDGPYHSNFRVVRHRRSRNIGDYIVRCIFSFCLFLVGLRLILFFQK